MRKPRQSPKIVKEAEKLANCLEKRGMTAQARGLRTDLEYFFTRDKLDLLQLAVQIHQKNLFSECFGK